MPGSASRSAPRTASAACTSERRRSDRGTRFTSTFPECGPVFCEKTAVRPSGKPTSAIIVVAIGPLLLTSVLSTAPSIFCATTSVRSTRVPIGALKLTANCDSSLSGKNSVPMKRLRNSDTPNTSRMPATVSRRLRSTQPRLCA